MIRRSLLFQVCALGGLLACSGGGRAPLDPEPKRDIGFDVSLGFESREQVLDPATGDSLPRIHCRASGDLRVTTESIGTERLAGTMISSGTCQGEPGGALFVTVGPSGRIWEGQILEHAIGFQIAPGSGSDPFQERCDFSGSIISDEDSQVRIPMSMEGSAQCQDLKDGSRPPTTWTWKAIRRFD